MDTIINSDSVYVAGLLTTMFMDSAVNMHHHGLDIFETEASLESVTKIIEDLGYVVTNTAFETGIIFKSQSGLVCMQYDDNEYTVSVASNNHSDVSTLITTLRQSLIPIREKDGVVPFNFWSLKHGEPSRRLRKLSVPAWADIRGNYSASVKQAVDELVKLDETQIEGSGRLALVHGPPGSGKTHVIRSTAREWSKFCNMHYITDPINFFDNPEYMLSVCVDHSMEQDLRYSDYGSPSEARRRSNKKASRWNLLIMEDTDSLLMVDSKSNAGPQSFSNFLNLTDGLIGQGLNIIVFMSTNEPLSKIHDAVNRRYLAEIEFSPLSSAEIAAWNVEHGIPGADASIRTLSKLYATLHDHKRIVTRKEKSSMGFGSR